MKRISGFMMAAKIKINLSEHDGLYHVYARGVGDTEKEIKTLSRKVLDSFAKGKETLIRENVWAEAVYDYPTREPVIIGGVKFTFHDGEGAWRIADGSTELPVPFGSVQ